MNSKNFVRMMALILSTAFSVSAHADGGVGSGGGGTLPAEKVGIQDIVDAIQNSRNSIEALLKSAESDFLLKGTAGHTDSFPAVYSLFFSGHETVFDVLPKIQVQILKDGPCMGRDGQPYDGSVNTGKPYVVCMSASRMQEKLSKTNYQSEVTALMLHEISHLLGSTEDQAVEIQKFAVGPFAKTSSSAVFDWDTHVMEQINSYENSLDLATGAIESHAHVNCENIGKFLFWSSMEIFGELQTNWNMKMSLTREATAEYFNQLQIRLTAISDYLCTRPEFADNNTQITYSRKIDGLFGNHTQITAQEYTAGMDGPFPLITVMIPKFQSIEEAVTYLKETNQDLINMGRALNEQWQVKFPAL